VHVVAVENALVVIGNDRPQLLLSFTQGGITQVLSVAPQEIECYEPWLPAPKEKVAKLRLPRTVETDDLAVEDREGIELERQAQAAGIDAVASKSQAATELVSKAKALFASRKPHHNPANFRNAS
jgi:hypothetical protein